MSAPAGSLLVRVDADEAVGLGHLGRCTALAEAWTEAGGRVVFASCGPLNVDDLSPGLAAEVVVGPAEPATPEDVAWTSRLATEVDADWVVVDGYRFDAPFHRALRAHGPVLVIDDEAVPGRVDADLVLNQNPHATPTSYAWLPDARLLLGPRFTLLRRSFRVDRPPRASTSVLRILVTMGSSDHTDATALATDALGRLAHPFEARVLVGPLSPHLEDVRARAAADPRIEVLAGTDRMADHMAWADLAVTAGGTTTWELAHLGVPSLVVTMARNQEPVAAAVAAAGAGQDLGPASGLNVGRLAAAIDDLAARPELRAEQSRAGRALVDGEGAARVVAAMLGGTDG